MKARDCEEHRILRFNASNAQCDIDCPYCRIAELERDLAILNSAWEDATKSWQEEVALRQARLDAVLTTEIGGDKIRTFAAVRKALKALGGGDVD